VRSFWPRKMSTSAAVVDAQRIRKLNGAKPADGKLVIYWMSRDQRVSDNWALLYAQSLATESKVSLAVVFNLVPTFLQVQPLLALVCGREF
jgi:deoxyribodipyrimidine photo-lyase